MTNVRSKIIIDINEHLFYTIYCQQELNKKTRPQMLFQQHRTGFLTYHIYKRYETFYKIDGRGEKYVIRRKRKAEINNT